MPIIAVARYSESFEESEDWLLSLIRGGLSNQSKPIQVQEEEGISRLGAADARFIHVEH